MEESQENWIPHLEMEEDNFFNQSQRYYDPKEILQQQILCHETDQSHFPYPSSTLVEAATTTNNFQTSPINVQNNHSNTIVDKFLMGDQTTCNFHMVGNHKDVVENTLSNHILPFMNSSIGSAFQRSTTTQVNHSLRPMTHLKKVRSSSESADHIAAERQRRLKLTQNFIALSAMIPGLKKTEKSYILQEAINYVNKLQERVRELEIQNEKINIAYSALLDNKKLQLSINEEDSTTCDETDLAGYIFTEALPEVTARVLENNVLIGIHCEKQNDVVHKILNLVTNLHLSITSSSIFPFGASTLTITIIAQMKDEYSMTIDDLVKNLRKIIAEGPHDVQQ